MKGIGLGKVQLLRQPPYLRSLIQSRVLGAQALDFLLGRTPGSRKGLRFALSTCLLALELPLRSLRAGGCAVLGRRHTGLGHAVATATHMAVWPRWRGDRGLKGKGGGAEGGEGSTRSASPAVLA